MNPIANPNPVYSYSVTWKYIPFPEYKVFRVFGVTAVFGIFEKRETDDPRRQIFSKQSKLVVLQG
jgi:hypothetical protein